ncbi:NlpC/P60 family protein [Chelativorans sp. YIM 93263]|uniref:NlpC/P60 family protein n=1 Tax=Chelativorans sp. YIM 93263 TaxID=2906648 RepID=UPI002377E0F8|nr:NlpC/P60 family protein [Chelativorans sp. YIM 93263]
MRFADANAVIAEALAWIGTPYRHQASRKGVGCDCLGLIRGVWRGLYGAEPERTGAYSMDWAETGGGERLLEAARRHFVDCDALRRGRLVLFRWRPHLPAKHAGIMVEGDAFIHAYEGRGVVVSSLVPQWRRRVAGVFAFPALME